MYSLCLQDCNKTAWTNYCRIFWIKGAWKSGSRVEVKQICTVVQIKISLKFFEQRSVMTTFSFQLYPSAAADSPQCISSLDPHSQSFRLMVPSSPGIYKTHL